jgi:ATP-dependent RNA helicase DDX24/MAK5
MQTDANSETAGPDDDDPVFAETSTILTQSLPREDMQTFVFSATLSKDLQQNLKKRYKGGKKGAKRATALGMSLCHPISAA